MLQTFAVPVRSREFRLLRQLPSFTLVLPNTSSFLEKLGIDTLVSLLVYNEHDYEELGMGNVDVRNNVRAIQNYDVMYIRECRLKDVVRSEWAKNYGPPGSQEFIEAGDGMFNVDSVVKVVNFEKHNYDLASLNRDYEQPKSTKKRTSRPRHRH